MKNNSNCDKNRRVNMHFFLSINPSKKQTKINTLEKVKAVKMNMI